MYKNIYFEGEKNFLWEVESLDSKVFAEKEDGSIDEFILRDLLIKE